MNTFIRGVRRQREVDIHPKGRGTAKFITKAGSGIKRPSILMIGYKEHVRIVVEHILSAVPMVNVGIHNSYFPQRIFLAKILDHDRLIVDIAKTSVAMGNAHGMMPGRPHQGKTVGNLFVHQGVRQNESAACGDQMSIRYLCLNIRHTEVRSGNVFVGSVSRFKLKQLRQIHDPLFEKLVSRIEQPFLTLGVCRRDRPVKCGKENQPCFSLH